MDIIQKKEIIKKHQASIPVKTVPLANDLGLEVYKMTGWPDSISGAIQKDNQRGGESGYAIFVNANHPETRRRFTIAHEIAHFVLHNHLIGDGITDDRLYRSGLTNFVEIQANEMAADILMPWDFINQEMARGVNNTVKDLANIFNVSKSSMSIRLGVPYEDNSTAVMKKLPK